MSGVVGIPSPHVPKLPTPATTSSPRTKDLVEGGHFTSDTVVLYPNALTVVYGTWVSGPMDTPQ